MRIIVQETQSAREARLLARLRALLLQSRITINPKTSPNPQEKTP